MRALTPRRLAHAGKASLLALLRRPSIPPPTTSWARPSPSHPRRCGRPGAATQASSWNRRLAAPQRRNGFVILRAARSPQAAPHPASRIFAVERRSCHRLHVAWPHMGWTFTSWQNNIADARFRARLRCATAPRNDGVDGPRRHHQCHAGDV